MNHITFDIETYSPSDSSRIDTKEFRVSVIGAYISWLNDGKGEYIAFFEDDVKDFLELVKCADLIVGYNQIWFDLPVLQKYSDFNLQKLPNYDILVKIEEKIGAKLKLNDVCKANFEDDIKTDSYSVYKHYHKNGKWLELVDYCMNDVRLTQQLFEKIATTKKLKYNDLHILKEIQMNEIEYGSNKIVETTESLM